MGGKLGGIKLDYWFFYSPTPTILDWWHTWALGLATPTFWLSPMPLPIGEAWWGQPKSSRLASRIRKLSGERYYCHLSLNYIKQLRLKNDVRLTLNPTLEVTTLLSIMNECQTRSKHWFWYCQCHEDGPIQDDSNDIPQPKWVSNRLPFTVDYALSWLILI